MAKAYNVIVVGAGPGGYVAAIRAAQLGYTVAVVEKRKELGGTCLNVGCIPSKALLESSEHYYRTKHELAVHGIDVEGVTLRFDVMQARREKVVAQTVEGIRYLFKKHKIEHLIGHGSFVDGETIEVTGDSGTELVTADHIILATGSEPVALPFAPFDEQRILSSTGALALTEVPKRLVVIGGGYIGLEMGSVYARLGCDVHVVELLDSIVPLMDKELSATLLKVLKKQGMSFHLSTKVTGIESSEEGVQVHTEGAKVTASTLAADCVLVAVGRKPLTTGLKLEAAGVVVDGRGFIEVDDRLRTSNPRVWAIGDVIRRGPMLAHKAEEEAVAVCERIDKQQPHVNYETIPGVIYTWPEVASVGKSEEELKAEGTAYKIGKFPFKASGRARAAEETEGFVKVLAAEADDRILGVHMIGPRCSDLIAEAVVAMEFCASAEDIARIVHAHPTFAEPFKEAALMATANRPIHL